MIKIEISTSCEPYMYNTICDIKSLNIGDIIDVKFKMASRVKKEYAGKTVKFFVNNILDYSYYSPYRRIAIIPFSKKDNFNYSDALIVDEYDRFYCLMIDLYPENRRPYAGWKNKEVDIYKTNEKIEIDFNSGITLRTDIKLKKNSMYIHPICEEHRILGCYGGLWLKTFEEFEDAFNLNHIKIIGYETPIPKINTRDFNFDDSFLCVTFKDIVKNEKYFLPGYLFKETFQEFDERLEKYVESTIDIIKKSKNGKYDNEPYNPYSIGVNYIMSDKYPNRINLLMKHTYDEQKNIINRCIEFFDLQEELKY